MKGKVLAGLILSGAIYFSGIASAAQLPDMPDKPELPKPPSMEGQFPANDSVRPPMPPKGERMRPPKGSFDMKPPADFKPGDMKIPPVKK